MRNICVSFGENCLTDNILKRHGLKSFSTPYANCRSNIEYILQIERDRFSDLLNPEYLSWEYAGDKKVLRSSNYRKLQNFYDAMHMCGYEFTHYDVINNKAHRDAVQRRCDRLLNLGKDEDVFLNIFYYHRQNSNTDMYLLIDHLNELKEIYEARCKYAQVVMFQQIIVDDASMRRVEHHVINGIHIYSFFVMEIWAGPNQDVFWGYCDDDLIGQMLSSVIEITESEISMIEKNENDSNTNSRRKCGLGGFTNRLLPLIRKSKKRKS